MGEWLGAEVALDLAPGAAGRVVEPDGTTRQVLVTTVEPGVRIAWHWWEDGGELSTVEITTAPVEGGTRVHVVETVALTSRACADRRWSATLAAGVGRGVRPGVLTRV